MHWGLFQPEDLNICSLDLQIYRGGQDNTRLTFSKLASPFKETYNSFC